MRVMLAALLLAALAPAAWGAARPQVRLMVSGTAPLTVSGRGFPAKTGVSLTVVVGTTRLRKLVAASATGAFTASWTGVETHGCRPSSVTAVSGGIRAVWRSPVRAACATVVLP